MEIGNSTVKTPEAETETPTRIQPGSKASPFSNGVLKRHAPLHLHHHHHAVVVTYKECLKNHAAALGGHAVDGCGEFMTSPASNPSDPTSLKCAACGCHRNFHRREPEEPQLLLAAPPPNAAPALEYQPHHRHHPPPPPPPPPRGTSESSPNNSPSPPPISSSYYPSAPHMLLALSHGLSALPPPDCNNNTPMIPTATNATATPMMNPSSRKRYRTKFTSDQKEKMLEFAEKVGWKMQKRDEDSITEFCSDIGVDKGVFKVWMHNNKNTFGKKDPDPTHLPDRSAPPVAATTNGNGINYNSIAAAVYHQQHHQNEGINSDQSKQNVHVHGLATNGSSSS